MIIKLIRSKARFIGSHAHNRCKQNCQWMHICTFGATVKSTVIISIPFARVSINVLREYERWREREKNNLKWQEWMKEICTWRLEIVAQYSLHHRIELVGARQHYNSIVSIFGWTRFLHAFLKTFGHHYGVDLSDCFVIAISHSVTRSQSMLFFLSLVSRQHFICFFRKCENHRNFLCPKNYLLISIFCGNLCIH